MTDLTREQRSEIYVQNVDGSDCAVVALQALLGISRTAADELAERHGYPAPLGGMLREDFRRALSEGCGGKLTEVAPDYGETAATFAVSHPDGRYAIHVDGHVMALVDGDLYNGRSFWGYPVERAYRLP